MAQGGCKHGSASISGQEAYGLLKWESGTHRVQRIPDTETNGRIHTSAATVVVLAEVDQVCPPPPPPPPTHTHLSARSVAFQARRLPPSGLAAPVSNMSLASSVRPGMQICMLLQSCGNMRNVRRNDSRMGQRVSSRRRGVWCRWT